MKTFPKIIMPACLENAVKKKQQQRQRCHQPRKTELTLQSGTQISPEMLW